MGRLIGKWPYKKLTMTKPPYLNANKIAKENSYTKIKEREYESPNTSFNQKFAGTNLTGDVQQRLVFDNLKDTESQFAFHRFSWILDPNTSFDPNWVAELWKVWILDYGHVRDGLAWHPYTVSERLVNLLRFFVANDFPTPGTETLEILCDHGTHIFNNLEYYGIEHTGNHLVNNGRALYLAGIILEIEPWVIAGCKIIINESARLFNSTGEHREGSVHYHLLITSWYLECWLAAKSASRPEKEELVDIVNAALSAGFLFNLPGGLPLIGDVSPDCSPNYLLCLLNGKVEGWLLNRSSQEQKDVLNLISNAKKQSKNSLADWWRLDLSPWSTIWPKIRDGWEPYPGHGHSDFGSFELHFEEEKVFVDVGRRSYDKDGDIDKSAASHNVLMVSGEPAYPENRAYYSKEFKEFIAGPSPKWTRVDNEVSLFTSAFSRISGVESWTRKWSFSSCRLRIVDIVNGRGYHQIDRYFHTIFEPELLDNEIVCGPVRIAGAKNPIFFDTKYWPSYGEAINASTIRISSTDKLPFTGVLDIYYESSGKDRGAI